VREAFSRPNPGLAHGSLARGRPEPTFSLPATEPFLPPNRPDRKPSGPPPFEEALSAEEAAAEEEAEEEEEEEEEVASSSS
jgi:hypothetical protein